MQLDINLFDPTLRPRKVLLPARIFAPALGAVALLLVTCAVLQFYETRVAAEARRRMEGRSVALQTEIRALGEQLGARRVSPEIEARAASREALRTARAAAVAALRSSNGVRHGGHARFLRALARQSVDGLWLTEVTVAGAGDIALRGRTLDPELVADYLKRLGREESLHGLAFDQLAFQRPVTPESATAPRFMEFSVTSTGVGEGEPSPSASANPQHSPAMPVPAHPSPSAAPDVAALAQATPATEAPR